MCLRLVGLCSQPFTLSWTLHSGDHLIGFLHGPCLLSRTLGNTTTLSGRIFKEISLKIVGQPFHATFSATRKTNSAFPTATFQRNVVLSWLYTMQTFWAGREHPSEWVGELIEPVRTQLVLRWVAKKWGLEMMGQLLSQWSGRSLVAWGYP